MDRRDSFVFRQHRSRDDRALYLGGPLVDAQRADLAIESLDDMPMGDAKGSVYLNGFVDDTLGCLRRVELCHRRGPPRVVRARASVNERGRLLYQEPRRIEPGGHISQLESNRLEVREWPAELMSLLRTAQRFVQSPAGKAGRGGSDRRTESVEHRKSEVMPLSLAPQKAVRGDPAS